MVEKYGRGFRHSFSDEALKKWMDMKPVHKLEWLEEINLFLSKGVPEKNKEIIEKFRKGEI